MNYPITCPHCKTVIDSALSMKDTRVEFTKHLVLKHPPSTEVNHILRLGDRRPLCSDPKGEQDFVIGEYDLDKKYCAECKAILDKWNSDS